MSETKKPKITIIEEKFQDSELKKWHGSRAQLWMFHVSLKKFALKFSKSNEEEALYIVALGCEHIVGKFSWEPANISISKRTTDKGETFCYITDKAAGFELQCSSAAIARGPANRLDTSFENFLK